MNGIQSTTDYKQFKLVKGNRKIFVDHLNDLTVSIGKKNMLAVNPIIVNEKMEVIDGQHRLKVAENNKLPIFYMTIPDVKIDEVILLNANNKPWTLMDYVNSYAERGFEDYVWFKNFIKDYSLAPSNGLLFIYGAGIRWVRQFVISGKMELTDTQKKKAEERADFLYDLRPYINRRGSLPREFLTAVIEVYEKGFTKKIIAGLKNSGKQFMPELITKNAINQLMRFV